jgi:hypothetical protein
LSLGRAITMECAFPQQLGHCGTVPEKGDCMAPRLLLWGSSAGSSSNGITRAASLISLTNQEELKLEDKNGHDEQSCVLVPFSCFGLNRHARGSLVSTVVGIGQKWLTFFSVFEPFVQTNFVSDEIRSIPLLTRLIPLLIPFDYRCDTGRACPLTMPSLARGSNLPTVLLFAQVKCFVVRSAHPAAGRYRWTVVVCSRCHRQTHSHRHILSQFVSLCTNTR